METDDLDTAPQKADIQEKDTSLEIKNFDSAPQEADAQEKDADLEIDDFNIASEAVNNLREVRKKIATYASETGQRPESIRLIAVSKNARIFPVRRVFRLSHQRAFGESYIQGLEEKASALPPGAEWHMIGHLQTNKVDKAAHLARWIHSVDSEKLLRCLENACTGKKRKLNILLQVNWTGEDSKYGVRGMDALRALTEQALACRNLRFRGLMTIAEAGADSKRLRETFAGVRKMRDKLQDEFNIDLPELSMGMTADYREAILEGSTMVRIGTAIFGTRK